MEDASEIKYVFWIGTTVMLFLAFGLLFLVLFYQRHFAKMKREEAALLLKATLDSEKRERQRIAKDLHDSVQGDIGAIRNYFSLLSKKISDPEAQELINEIKEALEQIMENTRLISNKLMPPLLETAGFGFAVQEYFNALTKSTGKNFRLQNDFSNIAIPNAIGYELFRIVQEFTQNMLKHGSITTCKLFIYKTDEGISLEIVDDGVFFDFKSSYVQSKGSGLYNIQSRLNSIHARLEQRTIVNGNHFVIYLNEES